MNPMNSRVGFQLFLRDDTHYGLRNQRKMLNRKNPPNSFEPDGRGGGEVNNPWVWFGKHRKARVRVFVSVVRRSGQSPPPPHTHTWTRPI